MQNATRRREQEVWHACDDLWALNADFKAITGESIRERLLILGKCRGSPNEIYKYRKTWMDNRGVGGSAAQSSLDNAENDPISRAVRLVHEKLQSETDEQIQFLKEAHLETLQEKDTEISKIKNDIAALMAEFAKVQENHGIATKTLDLTKNQLQAEIAVRKAMEAELDKTLQISEKSLQAKTLLLAELKEAHIQEIARYEQSHQNWVDDLRLQLAKSEQANRELGQEYSEKLTEAKTVSYNLAILQKRAEEKSEQVSTQLRVLEEKLGEFQEKTHSLSDEVKHLKVRLAKSHEKIHELTRESALKTKQNRAVRLVLKKCELKLARLRAMNHVHNS